MKRSRTSSSRAAAAPSKGSVAAPVKKAASSSSSSSSSPTAEAPCRTALLVLGNYHAVMAGLVLKKEKFYLKFAIKHHIGNVNDVAVTERYVASCGADERVFLFTNKAEQKLTAAQRERLQAAGEARAMRLADLGSLAPPCEVVCLRFTEGAQYLLCGCVDGQLLVYRTRDWALTNNLAVHEKAVVSLDVHPGSGGALAVSVGADRSVAVLDLAKGRLLTKWKYNATAAAAADGDEEEEDEASDDDEGEEGEPSKAHAKKKKAKKETNPLARLFAREEPTRVLFSPQGTHFLIQARFSFVVYSSATMGVVRAVQLTQPPQPQEELHCMTFLDEETVVLGNESAQILFMRVAGANPSKEPVPVTVAYPAAVKAEADALLATPIQVDREVRKKNPLRHVSRVKALRKEGGTLFSVDSNGLVFSWALTMPPSSGKDGRPTLTYVTSANCQGRVTSLDVLPL